MSNSSIQNTKNLNSGFSRFKPVRERLGLIITLIAEIILFSLLSPYFLTWQNISGLMLAIALGGIVAAGMTIVIISGGFDLSVGSTVALTCTTTGIMMHFGISQGLAIGAGLLVGVTVGLINGFLIAKLKINPLISTLAMMVIVKGLAYITTNGESFAIYKTVPNFPSFGFWGRGNLFSIPIPVIGMIIVMIIVYVLLNSTILGREIYAIGGNPEAARVSGVNVDRRIILVYLIMGILASIAGILLTSRLASGHPNTGNGYELSAIAAVVLGGATLGGGKGKIQDTFLAVLVLGILGNGFVLLGLSSFLQDVARGVVLLLSVGIDQIRQGRRSI